METANQVVGWSKSNWEKKGQRRPIYNDGYQRKTDKDSKCTIKKSHSYRRVGLFSVWPGRGQGEWAHVVVWEPISEKLVNKVSRIFIGFSSSLRFSWQ